MPNDYDPNDFMEGIIEPEDYFCQKCKRKVELPRWDGPFEKYETEDGLHARSCNLCGILLCDDCSNWQESDNHGTVCFECYDEEMHYRHEFKIHKAINFAAKKHKDQLRKGTDIPYISHIMEVMQILIENTDYEDIIIAGILHDTLEDTDTTEEEIEKLFGKEILRIVKSLTEDKKLNWFERKKHTIRHLHSFLYEAKYICFADKLSNIRSIYLDLHEIGDDVWKRFNAEKKDIKWYYENLAKEFGKIKDLSESDSFYEFEELVNDVFNLDWSDYKKG